MKIELTETEQSAITKLTEAVTTLPTDLWFSIEEDDDEDGFCLVVWKRDKTRPGVSVEVAKVRLDG